VIFVTMRCISGMITKNKLLGLDRPEVYKRQKRLLMDYYSKENSMATLNGVASISEAFDEMRRLHSSLQRAES